MSYDSLRRCAGRNVIQWNDRTKRIITRLPGGCFVRGVPHPTRRYLDHALLLGYGWAEDPRWELCKEHEALHTLLCVEMDQEESPTMRDVARKRAREHVGEYKVPWYQWIEEGWVLDLQHYLNTNDIGTSKNHGAIYELSWEIDLPDFRRRALQFLRGGEQFLAWESLTPAPGSR